MSFFGKCILEKEFLSDVNFNSDKILFDNDSVNSSFKISIKLCIATLIIF